MLDASGWDVCWVKEDADYKKHNHNLLFFFFFLSKKEELPTFCASTSLRSSSFQRAAEAQPGSNSPKYNKLFFIPCAGLDMLTNLLGSQDDVMQRENGHMFSYFTNRESTDRDEAVCQRARLFRNPYHTHTHIHTQGEAAATGCSGNILTHT